MAIQQIQKPLFDIKLGRGLLEKDRRGKVTIKPVECTKEEQDANDSSPTLHQVALEVMKVDLASRDNWMNDKPEDFVPKYFDWAQAMWEESVKRTEEMGK